MLLVDLQIAGRNLLKHSKRNLFLAGAVAVVTMLLVVMGALSAGVEGTMLESATTLMSGHVNVGGFYKVTSGNAAPLVSEAGRVLQETRRLAPEISYVTQRLRGYAKAVAGPKSMDISLGGIHVTSELGFQRVIRLKRGTLEELEKPGTILLFEDQAARLAVDEGDTITLVAPTTRGASNTVDVRVAAIAKNLGILSSFTAFLPAETLRQLYNLKSDTTGALHVYLHDVSQAEKVATRLRAGLMEAGWRVMDPDPRPFWEKLIGRVNSEDWTGQKLDVTTWSDELTFISWILRAIIGLTGVLVFILLVIVVIGILNTLAIAIRERTREIGTLRAIGMQRRKVIWLFLLEEALLGVVGTLAGAGAGLGAVAALNAAHLSLPDSVRMFLMQQHLTLIVQSRTVVLDVLFVAAVTTLAAVLPALQAARLKPVTAMHHIG